MKKSVLTACAVIFMAPALVFAGSVTSRWDMTIGGYVKFDVGYADKGVGLDYSTSPRDSIRGNQNVYAEYGNWYWGAGETRLNMRIKGPDGWGAKTSAFIEGEFRGAASSGYGVFAMRHAFMKMDWPNATLTLGHTWQRWGWLPSYTAVGASYGMQNFSPFNKGQRQPRMDLEYRFGPGFSTSFAVMSNTNTLYATATNGGVVNQNTMGDYPWAEGEFKYTTDKCGKIGPYGLIAAIGGFYGQSKYAYTTSAANAPIRYSDTKVNAWGVAIKSFIPIIPEKNKNKAGALAIGGQLFYGQNMNNWFNVGVAPYIANSTTTSVSYSAPASFGGWGQITYFFTDKLFADAYFGYIRNNLSQPYMSQTNALGNLVNANTIQNTSQLILNLSYDVNQALRFGIEYAYVKTRYANYLYTSTNAAGAAIPGNGNVYDKEGSFNSVRIGAYYFF